MTIRTPEDKAHFQVKIVVIEDSASDVRLFKEALRSNEIDADVSYFPDAVQAITALHLNGLAWNPLPDIVFLDLNMPKLSGFEVLRVLKATPACAKVRVAIFTSSNARSDMMKASQMNADAYVTKPSLMQDYFDSVDQIIKELS